MASTRALLLSVLGTVVLVPFVAGGCAEPEPVTDSNVLANVDTSASVTPKWSPPPGRCPSPAIGSTQPTEYYQRRATSAMMYLVGGSSPFQKKELDANSECVAAYDCTTLLRGYLDTKDVTLQPAVRAIACGLPAALYSIDFSAQMPQSLYDSMSSCGLHLDNCWGQGVSGFYYADPDNRVRRVYLDPEPARLAQDLYGTNGATAAAIYTNTLLETTVTKWSGSYTSSATPPAAGLPCATGDLPEGIETLKVLQGSGAYRRCY